MSQQLALETLIDHLKGENAELAARAARLQVKMNEVQRKRNEVEGQIGFIRGLLAEWGSTDAKSNAVD